MKKPLFSLARASFVPPATRRETTSGGITGKLGLVMACALALPGCATLTTGSYQSIAVRSEPPGATCQIRQGSTILGIVSPTPGTILVNKNRSDIGIDCAKPGYFPGAAVVQSHFQEAALGNVLFATLEGLVVGLIVDTASGAIKEYPRWVTVFMKPQSSAIQSPVGLTREEVMRTVVTDSAWRHGTPQAHPN